MEVYIPENIEENEILVYFVFNRDFKKKIASFDNIISKDIFLPNKGSVSLQRNKYCDETKCKSLAKKIEHNRIYTGFVIFRKIDFKTVKKKYITEDREDFDAELIYSPLDENLNKIELPKKILSSDSGNPAHSEIKYLNPAVKENETPNTAIRSFSRKLYKKCKLIIDDEPNLKYYNGELFKDII